MAKLTDKQQMFVKEYLIDLNATQAAIRAGYSEETAKQIGSENLSKLDIQKAIQVAQQERNKELSVDANYVLSRLIEIDKMDIADILDEDGNVKAVSEWSAAWRKSISGVDIQQIQSSDDVVSFVKKLKFPDKLKNLELLGKHVGVKAFGQADVSIKNNLGDSISELMKEISDNAQ